MPTYDFFHILLIGMHNNFACSCYTQI